MRARFVVLLATALALCLAQEPPASPPAKLPELEEEPPVAVEPEAAAEPEAAPEEEAEPLEEEEEEEAPPPTIAIDAPTPKPTSAQSAPSPAAGSKASVQFMITAEMKGKLLALGYSEEDIALLQPERARVIVNNGLKRTSKLPSSWTRSPHREGPIVQAWRRVKQHSWTPAGVAGVAAGVLVASLSSRQSNFRFAAPRAVAKPVNVNLAKAKAPSSPSPLGDREPEGLWLDRQIDKVIAWVGGALRR
jgi:hypothetical protein